MMKTYTLKDLTELKKEHRNLVNMAKEMIELGVINGDYRKEDLKNKDFINQYLLDELNFGCIIIG